MTAKIHAFDPAKNSPKTLPEALAKIRELEDQISFQKECLRKCAPEITLRSEVEQAMVKYFKTVEQL